MASAVSSRHGNTRLHAKCDLTVVREPTLCERGSTQTLGLMKNAQWFALAAGCLVVGLVGGGFLGVRFAQSLAAAEQTLALGQAVQGLEAARTSGNDAAYEEAMRQHIAFLQLNERSAQPLLGEKAFALDLALAYARLSILAGKRGADVESSRLLQKASPSAPQSAGQNVLRREFSPSHRRLTAIFLNTLVQASDTR